MKAITYISNIQDRRPIWLLMAFTGLTLELIAQFFFQEYLYMPPCEQCVYIRFSMFCMMIAGFVTAINPKNIALKLFGYVVAFYGIIKGIGFSLALDKIHTAIHSGNIFGMIGCSLEPKYPFGLPLHKIMPSTFLPTGDCGYDHPVVPSGIELNSIQTYFTNIYADGWYLLPSIKFMNMAEAMLVCFVVCTIILSVMLISFAINKFLCK